MGKRTGAYVDGKPACVRCGKRGHTVTVEHAARPIESGVAEPIAEVPTAQLGLDIGDVEVKLPTKRGPALYQPGLFQERES